MKNTHTIIEQDVTEEEWYSLVQILEQLSEADIVKIASLCELSFTGTSQLDKDDYINIIDETYWDVLANAYKQVVGTDLV